MSLPVDPAVIARRAQELAVELVELFGPRPAGSPAETAARGWAAQQLSRWNYQTQFQPVRFPPFPQTTYTIPVAGILLAACAWLIAPLPFLPLLAPLGFYFLPYLLRQEVKRRECTASSENLFAAPKRSDSARHLLLVAHLDSAPARSMPGPALQLYSRSLDLGQRAAFAIAAGGLLQLLGIRLPAALLVGFGVFGAISGGWLALGELWSQKTRPGDFSPGGNDNASGVGVVLALAEHFSANPGTNTNLDVLITTAEETGMQGSQTFVKTLDPGKPLHVLCFDTVGCGPDLRYAVRDGTWKSLHFSRQMNTWISQALPESRPLWYIEKSGDHAPFAETGFPTAAVQVTGSPAADLRYHTAADSTVYLEQRSLSLAVSAALAVIEQLEKIEKP